MIFNRNRLVSLAATALAFCLSATASADTFLIAQLTGKTAPDVLAKKYGVTLKDTTANAPFALFSTPTAQMALSAQAKMSADTANFVWVEDDAVLNSPESQSKTSPVKLYEKGGQVASVGDRGKLQTINKNFLGQISWNANLANATGGRVVRVAILDNGLSPKQSALWGKVDASLNAVEPGKPAYDQPMKQDSNRNGKLDEAVGHGTMIAGIIDQIAPSVRLVIARVSDSDGNAGAWTIIKGLAFAVSSKAEVANISLGSLSQVVALSDVVDWCEQKNLLVVAAIGNNATKAACFPARISKVVCVSGLNADDTKAVFSNWEGTADAAAPAVGFASQFWDGTLAIWSGTSFASPVVVGSIADCLRRLPRASTPDALRKALKSAGTSIDNLNPAYKSNLGYLINHTRLDQTLRKP